MPRHGASAMPVTVLGAGANVLQALQEEEDHDAHQRREPVQRLPGRGTIIKYSFFLIYIKGNTL